MVVFRPHYREKLGLRRGLLIVLVACCIVSPCFGADDEDVALRKYHPWGRFHVGSWNRVRVVTETLDGDGKVTATSVTDTKTTLIERMLESYTLKVEAVVEVAGKRIPSQPQIVKQGYAGEPVGEPLTFRDVDSGNVAIEGKQIPCACQEVEVVSGGQKRVTLVRYADSVAPFVLERKTIATDLASKLETTEAEFEVLALDMPFKIVGQLRPTAHARLTQRGPRGSTTMLSVVSADVPGELVQQTAKKVDERGRVTHRSTVDLLGYSLAPSPSPSDDDANQVRVPRRYYKKSRHDRR
jgi:hypothetical protein